MTCSGSCRRLDGRTEIISFSTFPLKIFESNFLFICIHVKKMSSLVTLSLRLYKKPFKVYINVKQLASCYGLNIKHSNLMV